ncbi:PREDICTED: neurosecretory protein VGF [Chrysochloris asiatica]|uniref:Neurosecretory protein VGF n=1 Tax=Chrysochloris asiatica TaxID=185453 RepID=A0A9B0TFJ1_CHRAS|nr:PREDICTED: neurosecretory protein VGF [Chrysochloris asiatica]
MKSPQLPAAALFCFLLLIRGLGAAPPGRPEAQLPPFSSDHKESVAGGTVPGSKDGNTPEVRAARNSETQDEGELFQGVDPRALAAVLLQVLDRPASPPAPGGSQQGPAEEAAESLLTETVRSQTHSLPVPETQAPPVPPRPQTQEESGPEEGYPTEELEALASLLQELRDFSPSNTKRQQETAAAETETRTHTLTRVNLESPGPERVWRASWGEFQARVPERAPLSPPGAPQFQAHMPESGSLSQAHRFGEGVPSPKTHLGEALAPLSKAYQGLGASFPKAHRPESSLLGGSEAGDRLLQQGLAQVEAGRRQAEATRQAAAQEERLADLASDLLLQYLLQGGARQHGLGGRGLQEEEERASQRAEEEAEQERRGGEDREEVEDEEAAEAEAEAEEAERARQNALLFAEEEDGEAGAEDKRSQEETPGHRRKEAEGAEEGGEEEDDDEEMDPQTIDSLIELSTKLHLPADDVVSIIEEVEEKRKRKKNAPPEPVPPPRDAPAPTHVRSPQPPPPAPAHDELPEWNEVLPPWDREDEVYFPGPYHPFPNYIRPRTLQPPASSRRRHYHHALPPPRHSLGREAEAQARRAQEAAEAEERQLQEQEELENYIEHVLLRRP